MEVRRLWRRESDVLSNTVLSQEKAEAVSSMDMHCGGWRGLKNKIWAVGKLYRDFSGSLLVELCKSKSTIPNTFSTKTLHPCSS